MDKFSGFSSHQCQKLNSITNGLKRNQRQGFILAKAVRIASIAQPDNLDSFDLEKIINVDDVITSFLLRMCLPNERDNKTAFEGCCTPHAVALKSYEILSQAFHARKLESVFLNEEVYFCSNDQGYDCRTERGCCKRRRFMIAMVEKIISWLKNHESHLHDIDCADNVKFNFSEYEYNADEDLKTTDDASYSELNVVEKSCNRTDSRNNGELKSNRNEKKCCVIM